jgi:hypothetical protein
MFEGQRNYREQMGKVLVMRPKLRIVLKRPHLTSKSCELQQVTALNKHCCFDDRRAFIYHLLGLHVGCLVSSSARRVTEQDPSTTSGNTILPKTKLMHLGFTMLPF